MTDIAADVRYAIRMLAKSPGFAVIAISTLALAIGANTAIFSLVDTVLLRPLPFPGSDRIAAAHEADYERGIGEFSVSPPNYFDWRDRNRSFTALAAIDTEESALTGIPGRPAEKIRVTDATRELFTVLSVPPALGRTFTAEETTRGGPRAAVIGQSTWRNVFGSDPKILGRTIRLDAVDYPIVGVMPPGFEYPPGYGAVWVPLTFRANVMTQRGAHYLDVIGRLRPGITVEAAHRDLAAIHRQIHAENPGMTPGWTATTTLLHEQVSGRARPALLILLGAVLFVLLIACGNVANLLLARATARESELAVRAALGASRGRLVRQLLTESLVLSAAGSALGVALAAWGVSWIVRFGPQDLPRLADARLDVRVLLFGVGLAVVTAALFGTLPALRTARQGVDADLKSGGRSGSGSRESARLRHGLVVSEIALSLLLLAGAGLLLRSFSHLESTDPGFRTRNALTYDISLPDATYPDEEHVGRYYASLFERTRALPGVKSVAAIFGLPLSGLRFSSSFSVEGVPVAPENEPSAQVRIVSRDYFRTIGIRQPAGRGFGAGDRRGSPPVIVASESAAKKFWPSGDAIGHRVRFGARPGTTQLQGEIVGIVADVRDAGLDQTPTPFFYASLEQAPVSQVTVIVEGSVPAKTLAASVTGQVSALDRDVPVSDVRTMADVVSRSIARQKFSALLLTFFAGAALLLAAIGTYGVLAYGVGLRRREIGVRAALGAAPREVLLLVLRQGVLLAGLGTAIGLLAALGTTRLLSGLLFEVSPLDMVVLASAASLLIIVSVAASGVPAWRAARISPSEALRAE